VFVVARSHGVAAVKTEVHLNDVVCQTISKNPVSVFHVAVFERGQSSSICDISETCKPS
jgi:hypothetical protein